MRTVCVLSFVLLLFAPVFAAEPVHDDAIFDSVRIRIANDREVGGGRIDVKVENGVVELSGKVKTEKQKERAEKITRKVKGVKDVVNKIQVTPV
jgi:hyperosmotically inducible protein